MPPVLQLAILLAILLPATKIAASLCSRFGIPPILGELLVGVALGPGLLDLLHFRLFSGGEATSALLILAQIGGYVLMFVAGIETDIDRMREASVTAFLVALSGVIWPFILGAGAGRAFGLSWQVSCFLGGALTATSVSISARTLMDAGKMATQEATVILGAAVIDDVMGLFVLAFLAASTISSKGESFGVAATASGWLQHKLGFAAAHPLIIQMLMISVCVTIYFAIGYGAAKRYLDPLILQLRKLTATEAVPTCVLALVLLYAVSAEWLGSVAGITGAYLIGYVFAGSQFKADVERSFYAIGHGLLIPLFFVSVGLLSDFRALTGHWTLMLVVLFVAVVGKIIGCGLAAMGSGMDWIRSARVGFGMMSRGEVGLIVTAMGASSGIFDRAEVAVMVTVVLLTTLVTPIALRWTFAMKSAQDEEESLAAGEMNVTSITEHAAFPGEAPSAARDLRRDDASFRLGTPATAPTFLHTECAPRSREH